MKNIFHFSLPERLKFNRQEGQPDSSKPTQKKQKKAGFFYQADQDLQNDIHLPKTSIYEEEINKVSKPLNPASKNVLTLIGITSNNDAQLQEFLENQNTTSATIEYGNGNWAIITFEDGVIVESYDFVKPTIQIDQDLMVGCFIGHFQKEACIPVPVKKANSSGQMKTLFKIPPPDEDLTTIAFENKSYLTLVREFVFGEQEIIRRRGTLLTMLQSFFTGS